MSNSSDPDAPQEAFSADGLENLIITKDFPNLPAPGYGLKFSEKQAHQIAEFVSSPIFKMLKSVYEEQAKTRAAKQALNGANSIAWLSYYKGIAAAAQLFFKDLEAVRNELLKQEAKDEPDTAKAKK